MLREGRVTNYELTAIAKSGKTLVVSYNATTFYDQDGKLQGVFAAARDITEQKMLEQQLREQQNYLRGLIESSVDGLVTVDPDGVITDVNDRICEMAGYTRSELLGTPFNTYFTEPEHARAGVQRTFVKSSTSVSCHQRTFPQYMPCFIRSPHWRVPAGTAALPAQAPSRSSD